MTTIRRCVWCSMVGLGMVLASAPTGAARAQDEPPPPPREIPSEGFWPTRRFIDRAIDRITEEMAKQYNFDEEQLLNTRDVLKERFPRWMQENRAELQTLANQYFEALVSGDPPAPEEVASWASRALPLFEQFTDLVDKTTDDLRTYMTDEQQVLLDGQLAAMKVGTTYMRQRLATWEQGGYDWQTEWPRSEAFKRRQEERRTQLEREADRERRKAMGLPSEPEPGAAGSSTERNPAPPAQTRPASAKDDWVAYVEDFIKRYQLDEAQQNSARKILASLSEQRDKYLRGKLSEIQRLEEKLNAAQTDEERDKVRAECERVNRPLERYFQQLKDRLDRLPTRDQRAAAAQADMAARAKAEDPLKAERRVKTEAPTETQPKGN